MTKFKEHDRVKVRFSSHPDKNGWVGKRLTITREDGDFYNNKETAYVDDESPYRWRESELELVTDEPTTQEAGPVRYVQVPEIVTGTYGRLTVGHVGRSADGLFSDLHINGMIISADEIDALCATLTSLSKALREMKE